MSTITREQSLAALTHDDFDVRTTFFGMFSEEESADVARSHRLLEAIDTFGWRHAFEFPHLLRNFAVDERVMDWIVAEWSRRGDGQPNTDDVLVLMRWFANAPVPLLRERLPYLADCPILGSAFREYHSNAAKKTFGNAQDRLRLSEIPIEACEGRLEETLQRCAATPKGFPHALVGEALDLSERLAAEPTAHLRQRVMEWLAFDVSREEEIGHWRVGIAIDLAGRLGMAEAMPRLLELLSDDWDWLRESVTLAGIRMGSPAALDAVVDTYATLGHSARLYAAPILEAVRFPGVDLRIRALLPDEGDPDLYFCLGLALARYGSPEAETAAMRIYEEYSDHPESDPIAKTLYANRTLRRENDPMMVEWKQGFEASRRRKARLLTGDFRSTTSSASANADKIGRNDPCPCGSGKKYKKCCYGKVA